MKKIISLLLCIALFLQAGFIVLADDDFIPSQGAQWLLDLMDGVDVAANGYGQYDEIFLAKCLLGRRLTVNSAMLPTTSEVQMFTSPGGQFYAKYQKLLDDDAYAVKAWLEDLSTQKEGENWQLYYARIQGCAAIFTYEPGIYRDEAAPSNALRGVEPGRRLSILGSDTYEDSVWGKIITAKEDELSTMFQEECYRPAKIVDKLIEDMDPAVEADVLAAREAYDKLDLLSRASVMDYHLLTRAEGNVSDAKPDNLVSVGMRKPTGADTGFTAANHKAALDYMQDILPGTHPWYVWIAGVSSGQMSIGLPDTDAGWATLAASGVLTKPIQYYKDMGITLTNTTGAMHEFFTYLDTIPGAEVYLQVENMFKPVEPQIDVMRYLALRYECVKGFAIDVEWYLHNTTNFGLPVTDYRAKALNEYIYETWGPKYGLALKHYNSAHLPATYRGGEEGKSNLIVFVDDTQSYASFDGSHGNRFAPPDRGDGMSPGNGGDWVLFSQFFYPGIVIFQTGYQPDQIWTYGFEDPLIRSYAIKLADVVAPDQDFGVAWVNFNRNAYREFPVDGVTSVANRVSALTTILNGFFRLYTGQRSNTFDSTGVTGGSRDAYIAGAFGFFAQFAGNPDAAALIANAEKRLPINAPTVFDCMVVRAIRESITAVAALPGANMSTVTNHVTYPRFLEIEAMATAIRIKSLPAYEALGMKDYGTVMALMQTYEELTAAQKAHVLSDYHKDLTAKYDIYWSLSEVAGELFAAYDKMQALAGAEYPVTVQAVGEGKLTGDYLDKYAYTRVGHEIVLSAEIINDGEFLGWEIEGGGYILDKSSLTTPARISVPDDPDKGIVITARFSRTPLADIYITGPGSLESGPDAKAAYTVYAEYMPLVSGIELEFELDGSYLGADSFTAVGFDFIGRGDYGTPIVWKNSGDTWTGKVTLFNAAGVSGDTDLLYMTLKAVEGKLGTTGVKLTSVKMSYAGSPVPAEIVVDTAETAFLQYYVRCDLNRDGVVDINDITYALLYFMSTAGDPDWETAKIADINGDDQVDVDDLLIILANYTIPYYN